MNKKYENLSFGELVLALRKKHKWTVKEFIKRLEIKGHAPISPAYITRIEQYGEIPSPELICRIADVFEYDEQELFEHAKRIKVQKFDQSLQEKYQKASGWYRTQRTNKP
jgi:transcriptional regulator with XRE-family HTH domain